MEIIKELGIDPTVIVVNIIGFLVLVALLKKLLYKPVTSALEDRANEIRATYEAAEAEKANMEQIRAEYEKQLAGIEAEAREKIQAAVKEAQSIRDEIIAEAREKSETIIKRGDEELAREREKTIVELRQEVADLVVGVSSKLIERELDDATHRKLIDEYISSVGTV